jgi:hypothetical protein
VGFGITAPLSAAIGLTCVLACNSISGVEGYGEASCVGEACNTDDSTTPSSQPEIPVSGSSGGAGTSSSSSGASSSSGMSSGNPMNEAGPTTPSYCTGITFYVPFDGDRNSRAGQIPSVSDGDSLFITAKYGQGVTFNPDAAFVYGASHAGKAIHRPDVGSVMMWVKPETNNATTRPFFRPQTSSHESGNAMHELSGPSLALGDSGELGMFFSGAKASAQPQNVVGWSNTAFHLVVGTWNAAQRITFNVVTGSGAGTLTRIDSPGTFTPRATSTVRIGDEGLNTQAIIDEVAIWDRELTTAEITQLFQATASIGNTCPP